MLFKFNILVLISFFKFIKTKMNYAKLPPFPSFHLMTLTDMNFMANKSQATWRLKKKK